MITYSIIGKDVMISDSTTGKHVTTTTRQQRQSTSARGRKGRYERDNSRRITLASATTDDLRAAVDELRFGQRADQYMSLDDQSDDDHSIDYESDPDTDYMEVGREVNRATLPTERGEPVRSGPNSMSRAEVPADHSGRADKRDQGNQRHRQDHLIKIRPGVPVVRVVQQATTLIFCRRRCKFCKQVHNSGRCELLTEFEILLKFVKSLVG